MIAGAFVDGASLEDLRGELLALVATVAVRAVLAGGFEVSGRLGAERAMAELRARLVDQLLRRRPGGLRDARTGELAAAAVQGIDSLEAYFARYLPQLVLAALAPPAIVVYLAFHDPVAAAVLAVTIPLIPVFMILADVDALQHLYLRGLGPPLIAVVVGAAAVVAAALVLPAAALVLGIGLLLAGIGVPALVGALVRRAARRQAPARAALTADLVEVIDGAPELAALGREDDGAGRVAAAGDRLARLQRRDALAAGAAAAAGTLLANGAAVAVAAVGVVAVGDGTLDGVLLAAVVLLALGSFEAVTPLPDAARHLGASAKAAERLAEITAAPAAVRDPAVPRPLAAGDLALEDVRVRYEPGALWVLDGATLRLAPGRRVALAGASGAGQDDDRPAARPLPRSRGRPGHARRGRPARARAARRAPGGPAGRPGRLPVHRDDRPQGAAGPPRGDRRRGRGRARRGRPGGVDRLAAGRDRDAGGPRRLAGLRRPAPAHRARARAALPRPYLIVDEPTAHLDPAGGRAFLEHLATLPGDRAVLVITHELGGLERFDEVLWLREGRLTAM